MINRRRTDQASIGLHLERIERRILLIRGLKVLLDADLAELYGVQIRALNQAVSRNRDRFPADFMFRLSTAEYDALRSQNVILEKGSGRGQHRKYTSYAFTEQGVAMLSSVLRSKRAVAVNIQIMRTFVKLRRLLGSHKALARKLDELEQRYDGHFEVVFEAIRKLMEPPQIGKKRRIGYIISEE